MRPILPPKSSVNQTAPSGPVTMRLGKAPGSSGHSRKAPSSVIRPICVGAPLREPQRPVGTEREAEGQGVGSRDLEVGHVTGRGIEAGDRVDSLLGDVQGSVGRDDASLGNRVSACRQRELDDRAVRREPADVPAVPLGDPDRARRVDRQPARERIGRVGIGYGREVVLVVEQPDARVEADLLAARPGRDAERRGAGGHRECRDRPTRWCGRGGDRKRERNEQRNCDRSASDLDHLANLLVPGARDQSRRSPVSRDPDGSPRSGDEESTKQRAEAADRPGPAGLAGLPLTSRDDPRPERLHPPPRPLGVQPPRRARADHGPRRFGGRAGLRQPRPDRPRRPLRRRRLLPGRRRRRASSRSSASRPTSPAGR